MALLPLLKNVARGLLMGVADVVPGVSGGTMALIVGVYERLVKSISEGVSALLAAAAFDTAEMIAALRRVEWSMILPLGAGILAALLIGARFIPGLMETYPHESRGLFFGLVAGSIIIPWQRITEPGLMHGLAALGAAVLAFGLVGLPPQTVAAPGAVYVFIAASIAICAMILPGVSGAFFLLVFGIYEPTLQALNDRTVWYIATFVAGAAIGLGAFSKLLSYLLDRFYNLTMAVLVGLMAGSLRALWPYMDEHRSLHLPMESEPVAAVLLLALAGAGLVIIAHRWALRLTSEPEPYGASK